MARSINIFEAKSIICPSRMTVNNAGAMGIGAAGAGTTVFEGSRIKSLILPSASQALPTGHQVFGTGITLVKKLSQNYRSLRGARGLTGPRPCRKPVTYLFLFLLLLQGEFYAFTGELDVDPLGRRFEVDHDTILILHRRDAGPSTQRALCSG
jgi:hypothetical protein